MLVMMPEISCRMLHAVHNTMLAPILIYVQPQIWYLTELLFTRLLAALLRSPAGGGDVNAEHCAIWVFLDLAGLPMGRILAHLTCSLSGNSKGVNP